VTNATNLAQGVSGVSAKILKGRDHGPNGWLVVGWTSASGAGLSITSLFLHPKKKTTWNIMVETWPKLGPVSANWQTSWRISMNFCCQLWLVWDDIIQSNRELCLLQCVFFFLTFPEVLERGGQDGLVFVFLEEWTKVNTGLKFGNATFMSHLLWAWKRNTWW